MRSPTAKDLPADYVTRVDPIEIENLTRFEAPPNRLVANAAGDVG
jgi:hypothetical protein